MSSLPSNASAIESRGTASDREALHALVHADLERLSEAERMGETGIEFWCSSLALGRRMVGIKSALYVALEKRGHSVTFGEATVDGERIKFWCYEPEARKRVPLTPKELRERLSLDGRTWKQVIVPSGRPALVVKPTNYHGGGERRWNDKPGLPIEAQLENVVARFESIAELAVKGRVASEAYKRDLDERMRRAAERLRRERAAEDRREDLADFTSDWRKARRMTAFLDALEARIAVHPAPGALVKWLEWARAFVVDLDPLSDANLEAFRADAELSCHEPPDDEEWDEDEREWRANGWLDEYLET